MGAVLGAMRKLAQGLCPHVSKSLSKKMGWCSSQHGDRQSMKDQSRMDMRGTCRGRGWCPPTVSKPRPAPSISQSCFLHRAPSSLETLPDIPGGRHSTP